MELTEDFGVNSAVAVGALYVLRCQENSTGMLFKAHYEGAIAKINGIENQDLEVVIDKSSFPKLDASEGSPEELANVVAEHYKEVERGIGEVLSGIDVEKKCIIYIPNTDTVEFTSENGKRLVETLRERLEKDKVRYEYNNWIQEELADELEELRTMIKKDKN